MTAEKMRMELEESSQSSRDTQKQDEKGKMDTEKEEAEDISEEAWIVREVDQKEEIRGNMEAELKLLEDAAKLAVQMEMEDGERRLEQSVETDMENIIEQGWQSALFWTSLLRTGKKTLTLPEDWMRC